MFRRKRAFHCLYPGTALPPWLHYVPSAAKYECEAHEMHVRLRTVDGQPGPAATIDGGGFRCNALVPDTAFMERGMAYAKAGTALVAEQGDYSVRFAPVRKNSARGKIVGVLIGRRRLDDDYRTKSLPKDSKPKRRRGEMNAVNAQLMRDSEASHRRPKHHREAVHGFEEPHGGAVAFEPSDVVDVHRAHPESAPRLNLEARPADDEDEGSAEPPQAPRTTTIP